MKNVILTVILVFLVGVASAITLPSTEYGYGAPYSLTASEAGVIYRDMNSGRLWQSDSTTKGDWSELTPVVADGSASAPFEVMYADVINDGAVVSLTDAEKDQALNGTDTLDLAAASINGVNVFTAAERTQALTGSSTVDFLAQEVTASETVSNMLTLTPGDWPSTPVVGTVFVASTSKDLMLYDGSDWYTIDSTIWP